MFIKSSPRVETAVSSSPGACDSSRGRSQLSRRAQLPPGSAPGPAPGSAPTGPALGRPRPRWLDPPLQVRPSGSGPGPGSRFQSAPAYHVLSRRSLRGFSVSFLLDNPFGLCVTTYGLPFTVIKCNKRWFRVNKCVHLLAGVNFPQPPTHVTIPSSAPGQCFYFCS